MIKIWIFFWLCFVTTNNAGDIQASNVLRSIVCVEFELNNVPSTYPTPYPSDYETNWSDLEFDTLSILR